MKWYVVAEKKPDMFQRVLCVLNDKTKIMLMLTTNNTWKTMDNISLNPILYPTHWMPLDMLPLPEDTCYINCHECKKRHARGHMSKYMVRKLGK